jgi:Berberine and berberine like
MEKFYQEWLRLTGTHTGFVSYMTDQPGWEDEIFGDSLPRLVEIKDKWDPNDVFRNRIGIRPSKVRKSILKN